MQHNAKKAMYSNAAERNTMQRNAGPDGDEAARPLDRRTSPERRGGRDDHIAAIPTGRPSSLEKT
eukprot:3687799-Pyramimonas_sp.AAC.1